MSVQKRKKNYFHNNSYNQKKRKQFSLEAGMKGFLCTCNFSEKECVRDAYKLLNEFADEIYGPDTTKDNGEDKEESEKNDSVNKSKDSDNEGDISDSLNKEINKLKAEYSKPINARRFQVVDTGVKNVIFIRSTLTNPLELVTKIITELNNTKQQRTRFLLRLLPIEIICKANMNDIKSKADAMLEKYFAQEPKTFSIIFNRHSNNNIHRNEVIEDLAEIINKKNPGNKADLKNPELAVIVELIRGFCFMSVAPNYYKFKKYNLLEICNTKESTNDISQKKGDACFEGKKETDSDKTNIDEHSTIEIVHNDKE
ncbi:hypothetical protein E2986_02126 [Frieseomelitta varia]|uniref:THUMP domain-containing protein n=1 Tax=Frieseomelitta varia TaxID=561572 RepID=A0A833S2L3_9HYME|nr:THUMP domain-containing protein 1 homolog [Frieseomelitta varia]KAF3427801.1 hypothetical protein E2986_02126 [Frieseomelitta varia]